MHKVLSNQEKTVQEKCGAKPHNRIQASYLKFEDIFFEIFWFQEVIKAGFHFCVCDLYI